MSVYLISRFKIHDRALYDKYEDLFMPTFENSGGTLLSVDEEPRVLQGEWEHTRSVLIEFPDKESAFAWMMSPEYQAIAKYRLEGSEGQSIMVKGMDPA
ncbi:DUF1330 domain-containing protein [Parerythrobacter jejuensis]|uniref:DUF1330 domain-containing protein n=1 Tax=Parerythrobacter jejuensis TaxID=795812 RepID=A0A845AWM6_9SPHN|nr:DUF1330 domain-containing protein [Parerythrobacter jejuensis]MXP31189.1 DUF1330 domain-containing protein [Parerythrobacter jejuensis]MXP33949.1 DUF1330 domain-containing protein [Parerythrobacter jejuensis]